MSFADYSVNAIPFPGVAWDRVLVFTSWHNLGDGSSSEAIQWVMEPKQHGGPLHMGRDVRKKHGGRPGDAYEPYEGAAQGARYVPKLPPAVARQLRTPSPLFSKGWYHW
jgi:hypothetical protein